MKKKLDAEQIIEEERKEKSERVSSRGLSFKQELWLTGLQVGGSLLVATLGLVTACVNLKAANCDIQNNLQQLNNRQESQ